MKNLKKSYNIFTILFAVMLVVSVIAAPLYGLGDMSEYMSVFENTGLYNSGAESYRVSQQYGITNGEGAETVYEHFLSAVISLNKMLFSETVFDIHFLSVVYVLLFLVGMYFLQKSVRFEKGYMNYVFSLLLGVVFLDLGYVAYMNSFYSEALVFVLVIFVMSMTVSLVKSCSKLKLVSFVLASCLLSGLRPSCAVAVIALSVIMCVLLIGKKHKISATLVSLVACVALMSAVSANVPARDVKLYNLVYNDLSDAVAELNLNEEYKNAQTVEQMEKAVEGVTYADIIKYYLKNPSEFVAGVKSAVNNSYFLVLDYAPYRQYGESYGVRELFVPKVWNFLKRRVLPNGLWVMLAYIAAFAFVSVKEYVSRKKAGEDSAASLALASVVLPVGAVSELVGTVITTGKIMISKNMFVFGVYFDIMLIVTIVWAVSTLVNRRDNIKDKYGVQQ